MPFKDYKQSPLLPWLVPIIPKGAKLSPNSSLTPERIGKIPGRWTDQGWVGFEKFTQHTTTAKLCDAFDRYFKDGGGYEPIVGCRTDEHVLFDNDHDDAATNMIVDNAILRVLWQNKTLVRYRANSQRSAWIFRLKPGSRPITKRKHRFYTKDEDPAVVGKPHEIELLGKGQQCLIEGMHPSGVPYKWLDDKSPLTHYNEIIEVDAETVDCMWSEIKKDLIEHGHNFDIPRAVGAGGSGTSTADRDLIGVEHFDRAPDTALLAQLLKDFPATHADLVDRDSWIKFLMAIKAACGGDEEFYEEVVVPWNLEFPGMDEEYLRERWESFRESSLGWTYLVSIAQADSPALVGSLFGDANFDALTSDTAAEKAPPPQASLIGTTDVDIAEAFVQQWGKKSWCVMTRRGTDRALWMRCREGIWRPEPLTIHHDIATFMSRLSASMLANATNAKQREAALRLKNFAKAQSVARHVAAHPKMHVPVGEFDKRPWLMAYPGGYVDADNVLHEADPSMFFSRHLPFKPVFGGATPDWDKQMERVGMGEPDSIEGIYRVLGLCSSGTGQEQKLFFFEGSGGVGVTTILEIAGQCLGMTGDGYSKTISHKAFVKGNAERFLPADLQGAWMVIASEIEKREEWAMSTVKQATSSSTMPIEEKGFQGRTVPVTWQIMMQGNEVPHTGALDKAFMQRLIIIPVTGESIRDTAEDVRSYAKLVYEREGPAILGKLLEARLRYKQHGLLIPKRWRQRTKEYFGLMDTDGLWIEDNIEFTQDEGAREPVQLLWENRKDWGRDTGHLGNPGNVHWWSRRIQSHPEMRVHKVIWKRVSREPGGKDRTSWGHGLRLKKSSTVTGQFSDVQGDQKD